MAVMTLIHSILLRCTEGSSNKEYQVQVVETAPGLFGVRADNRRVGNAWTDQGMKADGLPLAKAEVKAEALVRSKLAKGYREISRTGPGATSSAAPAAASSPAITIPKKADSGVRPMLLNPIEEREALALTDDDQWVMQPKMDGSRMMLLAKGCHLTAINRKGQEIPLDEAVGRGLGCALGRSFLLDGEALADGFHVFDLLELDGVDLRRQGFMLRYAQLEGLAASFVPGGAIHLVPTFDTGKREALNALRAAKAEGVVFKQWRSPYTPSRPNTGGPALKLKFFETATCSVTAKNDKRSVALGVLDEAGVVVPVGNVTIPLSESIPEVGALVEIRYLYFYGRGGALYQPTFLGVRTDLDRANSLSQLKLKAGVGEEDE